MATRFQQGPILSQSAPAGVVQAFAGSAAPTGWLLCDGSAISRTTYAALFTALSTTYGVGDGSTTFNLPDMRGVYARGVGTNGTANYGGVTGHTPAGGALGNKGGQKTAKNGLANSSSTVSGITGSVSAPTISGSYGIGCSISGNNNALWHNTNNTLAGGDGANNAGAHYVLGSAFTASAPTFSQTGTGTAAAQGMNGDSETTPAFLAVNYIIKH